MAIVVNSHDILNCDANGLSWSPGGPYGDPPLGPVTSIPVFPLGIISFRCFLRRLLLGVNDTWKPGQYKPITGIGSIGYHIDPSRSLSMPTHGSTPSVEDFPAQGLRNRSNTLRNVSDENTKLFNSATTPNATLVQTPDPLACGPFDGLDELEHVLARTDPIGSFISRLTSLLSSNPSDSLRLVPLSPIANILNSNTSLPIETETSSSYCSSTNDETGLRYNLEPQVPKTQSHTCDNRVSAYTEYSKHGSFRKQSLSRRPPDTHDTSVAYWMSDGHAGLQIRTSEQTRGMQSSSSRSTSTAYGEFCCTRPSPGATERATPPVVGVVQRDRSLTDSANGDEVLQLPQAMQGLNSVKEESTEKTDKGHESLTDPQEDVDVNDFVKRVVWRSELREDVTKKPSTNGEETGATEEY